MSNKFHAAFAHVVSLAPLVSYIVLLSYLIHTAATEQLAFNYLIYLSVGISLLGFGYLAYWHFHPAKKPHSTTSALLYPIFYGTFYVFSELTKKR